MPAPDHGPADQKPELGTLYQRSLKARPRIEYSSEYFFRPLAHVVVRFLLPLRVAPTWLVAFHTVLGVIAGFLIARGDWVLAAVLIQIKTVLDNADGQLARASGMVTETGRYADTEGDLLVNAALFAGLSVATNLPWLALTAFVILTVLLSSDFNFEYLYRLERQEYFRPTPDTSKENQVVLRSLRWFYEIFFLPQDLAIRQFSNSRLERCLKGFPQGKHPKARLTYHEADTLWVLANVELSTQLAVLGLCLLLGQPVLYLWFVVACGLMLLALQWRRERLTLNILQGHQSPS